MLRAIIFSLILALCSQSYAAEKKPVILKNYGEALKMMHEKNAPGLIVFTADWCAPCQKFKQETLLPLLPKLSKNFVIYVVDVEKEPWVAENWRKAKRLDGLPSYHLLDRGGKNVIGSQEGFRGRAAFTQWGNTTISNWNKRNDPRMH